MPPLVWPVTNLVTFERSQTAAMTGASETTRNNSLTSSSQPTVDEHGVAGHLGTAG
jgi:hypothetical protein